MQALEIIVVYHLLRGDVFARGKVDIRDWILKRLVEVTESLPNQFPDLIQAYVDRHVILSAEESMCGTADCGLQLFTKSGNQKDFRMGHIGALAYSESVLNRVPIRQIVRYAEDYSGAGEAMEVIARKLVALVSSEFPYILNVMSLFDEENLKQG
ncbi:hypothetical protein HK097_000462 [Rhizophlyctis rosea]|uniref:Uncharacterized protein n=1 Tax=Rhizophlyctis rosea TaxID=64517 RepID=A0AAD5SGH0_9FUNG|nr:hypothetical protein HK097_000462 [Rhizophlyctis rosea]